MLKVIATSVVFSLIMFVVLIVVAILFFDSRTPRRRYV